MRIRNSRNPIDVLATIHSGPSNAVHAPLSGGFQAETPRPQPPAAPEFGLCVVNKSPWDVTPLVLAFVLADGLLHLRQQRCASHHDNNDGGYHQKASTQEASALEEKHGHFRSDTLSPCISSIKPCGNDWRRGGKGKQEGKRSKALCLKSEGLAADPTTISRSLQDSRRRAAKKGGEEGSPATKGSTEGVKRRTCKREDGKGWRCGNEAKAGSTLCEHHLSQVRSYCKRPSNGSSNRRSPSMPEGGEGRRKRPIAQSSSTTTSVGNDCYYYYYTGFGPAWRETKRKRVSVIAEVDGTDDDNDDGGGGGAAAVAAAAGGGVNGEGGEDGGKGKIKGRKRVKCRSLKSLL